MNLQNYEKFYTKTNNNYYSCQYIISFCTKYKRKIISNDIKEFLTTIFLNISKELDFKILSISIQENQVLLVINCNPKTGIYKIVTKLKNISAKELKNKYPFLETRVPSIWTRSEFISSIGTVKIEEINDFINNQNKQ